MSRRHAVLWLLLIAPLVLNAGGCRTFSTTPVVNPRGEEMLPNPLPVSLVDRWLVMDQISDELDNYFEIYREERIRIVDSVMTEGWIETHPKIGSTLLEPWHDDSTPGFERLHASLQTVRRFAKVRVIPTGGNYLIDVKVYKELEDLPTPEQATISGRIYRHDYTLDINDNQNDFGGRATPTQSNGWIPMGRDLSLEQKMLRNIQSRLKDIMNTPGPPRKK